MFTKHFWIRGPLQLMACGKEKSHKSCFQLSSAPLRGKEAQHCLPLLVFVTVGWADSAKSEALGFGTSKPKDSFGQTHSFEAGLDQSKRKAFGGHDSVVP